MAAAEPGKKMVTKKTYIGNVGITLTPAAPLANPIWQILIANGRFNLKSVFWTLRIFNSTIGTYIQPENTNVLFWQLAVAQLAGAGFTVAYDYTPDTAPNPSATDRRLVFWRTGQYFFNELFFQNNLTLLHMYGSTDLLNSYLINVNLTSEIEEL